MDFAASSAALYKSLSFAVGFLRSFSSAFSLSLSLSLSLRWMALAVQELGGLKRESRRLSFPGYAASC